MLIKKQRLSVNQKTKPNNTCCPQEAHCQYKDTYRVKAKGERKISSTNTNSKENLGSCINFRQSRFQSKENYQE